MKKDLILKLIEEKGRIAIHSAKKAFEILYNAFITLKYFVFCNNITYIWNESYYQCIKDEEALMIILNLINETDRSKISVSLPKNLLEMLRIDDRLQIDLESEAEKSRLFINVENGIYDILQKKLLSKDSKKIFKYIMGFNYVADASIDKAPAFQGFVSTSLGMESLKFLLEIIGYCCSALTGARAGFVLYGPGKRGKSLVLLLIESVIDESFRSSLSFSDLGKREYVVNLCDKLINICMDNDDSPMKNESLYKRICSGEPIMARDLYKSAITFKPVGKLIFAMNGILRFQNPDDELWDRVIPLCFTKAVPEEIRDPDLLQKLIKERDIILSMAVDTLCDLVKSGYKFSMVGDSIKYLQARRAELHPERDFLSTQTVLDPEGTVSSQRLWEAFNQHCKDNAVEPIGRNKFLKNVEDYDDGIIKTTIGPSNNRIKGFKGLRFKSVLELGVPDDKAGDE